MRSVCYEALHGDLTQSSITWWRKGGKAVFVSWETGRAALVLWPFHFGTAKCRCWAKQVGWVGQTSMERQLTRYWAPAAPLCVLSNTEFKKIGMWLIPLLMPGAYMLLLGEHLLKKKNYKCLPFILFQDPFLYLVRGVGVSIVSATNNLLTVGCAFPAVKQQLFPLT